MTVVPTSIGPGVHHATLGEYRAYRAGLSQTVGM